MKVIKNIDIYLTNKRPVKTIDVVQGDTGIQLVFTLKDFTIPSGSSATLFVEKPSGKFVYQNFNITVANNTITIDLENQALTEYGDIPYQVSIENGTDTVTTFTGMMIVQRSLKDSGAIKSGTVVRAFDELTVEKLAEFQARAETAANGVIATIPEDYTEMTAKVNGLANAIKGKLSGSVVRADDVSPVEHLPVVKVHGKNLIPYPYYNMGGIINGITYTVNDDGSVTAKGTATSNAALYLSKGLSGVKGTVFLSGCPNGGSITSSGGGFSLRMNKFVNGVEVTGGTDVGNGNRITLNGEEIRIYIVVLSGKTVDCTFYPMLCYGDTATEYTPYVDPSTVKVTRCGKNLINSANFATYHAGYFSNVALLESTENGKSIIVKGADGNSNSANSSGWLVLNYGKPFNLKVGDEITISADITLVEEGIYGKDIKFIIINNSVGGTISSHKFTIGEKSRYSTTKVIQSDGLHRFIIIVNSNTIKVENIMVSVNGEDGYEDYVNGEEYTTNTDGTINGLTSVSPTMTLLTDTEGVTVECEYNKDTNKVIQKLVNAISAMGGEVTI